MPTLLTHSFIPAFWGLALLVSWIGWGELVRRLAGIAPRHAGVGLLAGWGMAATLAMGGFLQLAHICNARALEILAWLGIALALFSASRGRAAIPFPEKRWRAFLPAALVLALIYCLSLKAPYLNNWDDYPAYLVYAKDLLANGIIDQPYSLRRLLTFGGQAQLDAMLLLHADIRNIDILELGLCRIVFVALVAGVALPRGRTQQILACIFLAGLALVPREHLPSENIQSEMTGLVLFLTLLRTLALAHRKTPWRVAIVAAVVAAAVSSMRVSYLPAAVFMIAFYYLGRMLLDRRHLLVHAGQLLLAAVAFGIVLLPWSLVLYQTSHTLLNPLWLGTQRPEYAFLAAPLTILQKIQWVVGFVYSPMQTDHTPLGLVMCVPLALALYRRHWRTELPVAIAAVITAVMILLEFTLGWYDTMYRYIFPIMFGITIALVYRALLQPVSTRQWRLAAVAALLIAALHVPLGIWWLVVTRPRVPEWRVSIEKVETMEPAYRAAQATVPAGERIYSATSLPIHFDFKRNQILIADIPGAASPSPGMPLFAGTAAVEDYLKAQGIHYVIYSDDDIQNMYNRAYWEKIHDKTGDNTPDIENVKKFYFAFLGALDEMGKSQHVRWREGSLVVVKLD